MIYETKISWFAGIKNVDIYFTPFLIHFITVAMPAYEG